MIELGKDPKQGVRKRQRRLHEIVALTVLGFFGVILVYVIVESMIDIRRVGLLMQTQQLRLAELQAVEDKRTQAIKQAENNQRAVFDLLANCRVATDIPTLTGGQLFCQHRGDRGFVLWAPEGKHRLQISAKVSFKASQDQPDQSVGSDGGSGEAEPVKTEYAWTVPLLGGKGYLFELESNGKVRPVAWRLTGNHADFVSQREVVPVEDVGADGWSYSGGNRVAFPNQCEPYQSIAGIQAAAGQPTPVNVYNLTIHGGQPGRKITIELTAGVVSDGPATVDPGEAARLISLGHPELLAPYTGDGKFELVPN
ncbi:MAG: hypothetical protein P1U77_07610 [Rubripirellula sp.]|jgi:hypothetical protein|nr:hypothetical protein [Rubripirellula sp.]